MSASTAAIGGGLAQQVIAGQPYNFTNDSVLQVAMNGGGCFAQSVQSTAGAFGQDADLERQNVSATNTFLDRCGDANNQLASHAAQVAESASDHLTG